VSQTRPSGAIKSLLRLSGPWQFVLWHYDVAQFGFLLPVIPITSFKARIPLSCFFQLSSLCIDTHTSSFLKGYLQSLAGIFPGTRPVKIFKSGLEKG